MKPNVSPMQSGRLTSCTFQLKNSMRRKLTTFVLSIFYIFPVLATNYSIKYDEANTRISFGARHIHSALDGCDLSPEGITIRLDEDRALDPQAYRITFPEPGLIHVVGGNDRGIMYGSLRLAELIRSDGIDGFDEEAMGPYIKRRGLKMDITLDARTVGYDDTGDCGQMNLTVVWEFDFWEEFLDNMPCIITMR